MKALKEAFGKSTLIPKEQKKMVPNSKLKRLAKIMKKQKAIA